jgi:hypothetical protein
MNRTKKLIVSLLVAGVVGLGASAAQAQETPPPSEPPPPPPASHSRSSGGDGAGIGLGAAVLLSGSGPIGAGQFVYDMSLFHVEGIFGFSSAEVNAMGDRGTDWLFGAGGWYHLHRGASSDLSLGGAIAINTTSGPGTSQTVTAFEPGVQARVFLTPNVALFGRAGLAFLFGDTGNGTNIILGGQSSGSFGFTYFLR